jgi:hypothetical protein
MIACGNHSRRLRNKDILNFATENVIIKRRIIEENSRNDGDEPL